jgi:hypothetical protein
MKSILFYFLALLISLNLKGQENPFHSNDFWKSQPDLNTVKELIKAGNDPVGLNQNGFDATVYAIIRKADNDVINYGYVLV